MTYMMFLTLAGWLIFITLLISLFNTSHRKLFTIIGWSITSISLFTFSYYEWFIQRSIVQSTLALLAGFLAIFVLYLIITNKTQMKYTNIFIVISSFILLLSYTITTFQSALIYNVTNETRFILDLIGYETILQESEGGMYIQFADNNLRTEIVMACTGIGSIALFAGFISALDTLSIQMKIIFVVISSSAIYILNTIRNVFIAGAYGGQWFQIQPKLIESIFGRGDEWVSFYIADRIISQIGAVIVMIIFAIGVIKIIDEETKLIDEWVYVIDEINKII